jgi:glutathione S-transferase
MALILHLAAKAYSSWSLRPWLALRVLGVDFAESVTPLDDPAGRAARLAIAPTGKAPILVDDGFVVWDSLAIIEYLAEKFLEKGFWPADAQDRARARSLCAEMHSGFMGLRPLCPTNFRREKRATPKELDEAAQADLARLETIFAGARGPFLFGDFSAADAYFAPVVNRIEIYALPLNAAARAYCDRILALPAYREWVEAARAEAWVVEKWENL